MIDFFWKIHQRLLSENRFSQYLLYAIGEIIIALQPNKKYFNWGVNFTPNGRILSYDNNIKVTSGYYHLIFKLSIKHINS